MLSTVQFIVPITVLPFVLVGMFSSPGRNLIRITAALISASASSA